MKTLDLNSYGVSEMNNFEMVNTDGQTCIPVPTCVNPGATVGVALGVAVGATATVTGIVGGVKGSLLGKVGNLLGGCGC